VILSACAARVLVSVPAFVSKESREIEHIDETGEQDGRRA
jgi:hypothetical protein